MKVHALALLSGLGAALIPGTPAQGEFEGFSWTYLSNSFGLWPARVYAHFTPEPSDRVLSVTGTIIEPAVRVYGGTLYQHPTFGGDTAPNFSLFALFPSLEFDTFVTIGRAFQPDATELSPGWPGFGDCFLTGPDVQWSVAPDHPQALPDAQGQVLLGQFTSDEFGHWMGVRLRVRMISAGQEIEVDWDQCLTIGSPCIAADINNDYSVDIEDFLFLIGAWGPDGSCRADIDADGVVGINDFLLLLADWGSTL